MGGKDHMPTNMIEPVFLHGAGLGGASISCTTHSNRTLHMPIPKIFPPRLSGSTPRELVRGLIAIDDNRVSMPAEHTATLAAGVTLILCAFLVPRRSSAVLQAAVGGALLLRAAAGRDGLRKWSGAPGARAPVEADESAIGGPRSV